MFGNACQRCHNIGKEKNVEEKEKNIQKGKDFEKTGKSKTEERQETEENTD